MHAVAHQTRSVIGKNEVATYIIMGAGIGCIVFAFILAMEALGKVKKLSLEIDDLVTNTQEMVDKTKTGQEEIAGMAAGIQGNPPGAFGLVQTKVDENSETTKQISKKIDRIQSSANDLKDAEGKLSGIFSPTGAFLAFGSFLFTTSLVVMGLVGTSTTG